MRYLYNSGRHAIEGNIHSDCALSDWKRPVTTAACGWPHAMFPVGGRQLCAGTFKPLGCIQTSQVSQSWPLSRAENYLNSLVTGPLVHAHRPIRLREGRPSSRISHLSCPKFHLQGFSGLGATGDSSDLSSLTLGQALTRQWWWAVTSSRSLTPETLPASICTMVLGAW